MFDKTQIWRAEGNLVVCGPYSQGGPLVHARCADRETAEHIVGLHNQRVNDLLTFGGAVTVKTVSGEILRPVRTSPEDATVSEVLHQLIDECGMEEVRAMLEMIDEEMQRGE